MGHKVFEIKVPEIWIQTYYLVASSKEEAINKTHYPKFLEEAINGGELELSHTDDVKNWDIKELKPDEIPEWLKL